MAGHKNLKLPVPAGFTITTGVCTHYYDHKRKYPRELKAQSRGSGPTIGVAPPRGSFSNGSGGSSTSPAPGFFCVRGGGRR